VPAQRRGRRDVVHVEVEGEISGGGADGGEAPDVVVGGVRARDDERPLAARIDLAVARRAGDSPRDGFPQDRDRPGRQLVLADRAKEPQSLGVGQAAGLDAVHHRVQELFGHARQRRVDRVEQRVVRLGPRPGRQVAGLFAAVHFRQGLQLPFGPGRAEVGDDHVQRLVRVPVDRADPLAHAGQGRDARQQDEEEPGEPDHGPAPADAPDHGAPRGRLRAAFRAPAAGVGRQVVPAPPAARLVAPAARQPAELQQQRAQRQQRHRGPGEDRPGPDAQQRRHGRG
jgi:hypothetical protein